MPIKRPNKRRKKRLPDKIKFIDLRFERGQVVGFRKGGGQGFP